MTIDNLRSEYRRTRKNALLFIDGTNAIFDFKVETVLGDLGLDRAPENFVYAAHKVLNGVLAAEDERQVEREYDALEERNMDGEWS